VKALQRYDKVEDNYYYKGLRRRMVEELRRKGIKDERILEVMERLPRHYFIDSGFEEQAYQDKPFPIDCGQTISQPYTVAYQTELLEVKPGDKVLEIGTGSGYQAAVLAMLGADVYTVERLRPLYERASRLLAKLRPGKLHVYLRDGFEGLPERAPFDKILVTAGAPEVPENLPGQLATGGRMVVPVGAGEVQEMYVIDRLSPASSGRPASQRGLASFGKANEFKETRKGRFRFVPMLKGLE